MNWVDFIQQQKAARKEDVLDKAGKNLIDALNGKLDEPEKSKSLQWRATRFVLEQNFGKAPQNINLGAGEKPVIVKIVIDKEKAEEALKRLDEPAKEPNKESSNPEKAV